MNSGVMNLHNHLEYGLTGLNSGLNNDANYIFVNGPEIIDSGYL